LWGLKAITRAINLGNSRVMTQEDKELLLKDLSARLTYGVMCSIKGYEEKYWDSNFERYITNSIDKPVRITGISIDKDCIELDSLGISEVYGSDDFGGLKPYLRPMSSMTSDEVLEYISLKENIVAIDTITYHFETYESIDWLNKKMFSYRTIDGKDMFELGLALEAPEGMYSIKDK
jgi:hypothetical protein